MFFSASIVNLSLMILTLSIIYCNTSELIITFNFKEYVDGDAENNNSEIIFRFPSHLRGRSVQPDDISYA